MITIMSMSMFSHSMCNFTGAVCRHPWYQPLLDEHSQVLRQMLLDRLDRSVIRWGCKVLAYTDDPDQPHVSLSLSDGSQVSRRCLS